MLTTTFKKMAKSNTGMKAAKEATAKIKETLKATNETLLEASEEIIKETVKTGEAWQNLMKIAIKKSEPLLEKQGDIFVDLAKGMKVEAEHGIKRFEKLTGVDFSKWMDNVEDLRPKTPKWFTEGFEYVSDQTEEIFKEVSKKGEEIAENVKEKAQEIAKEAEGFKVKAEARVKEVIKDVEARISDVAPKASAAGKAVKKTATKKKAAVKKATAKKPVAKKATAKKATAKKTVAKKTTTKKTVVAKKPAVKKTAAPKVQAPKAVAAKPTTEAKADDLRVIEGVGPKLATILNDAGYGSYALIAKADVADLKKVLDAAGSRYKMHNPTSWPLQAAFARDGRFAQLKNWQKNNDAQKA